MNKTLIYVSISIFCVFGYSFSCVHNKLTIKQKITNTLDSIIKINKIPGANLSIIYENGIQKNYSTGYSDIEKKELINENHIIFSGSIGKTYASAIIFQLVDKEVFSLDDKILDLLPNVNWMLKIPNINEITVEMLLQHTSGLPRYALKSEIWYGLKMNPDKVWTYKDRLSKIFNEKPLHPAGKSWAYSDTNYIILGMLIEKFTCNYYYDEVRKRLLIPNKLKNTFAADNRDIRNLSSGYSDLDIFQIHGKVIKKDRFVFNPQMEWTGGGIASSTPDLARWAKIYYYGKLFSDSLYNEMVTPNENAKSITENLAYGTGSFIYKTKYGKAYGHTGTFPGYLSVFAYYPKLKISVAMQINSDSPKNNFNFIRCLDKILRHVNY